MAEPTPNQVGLTVVQMKAIVAAADDVASESVLVRVEQGASDPATVEVWLFSDEAEGIVGIIEVDPAGAVTELDE